MKQFNLLIILIFNLLIENSSAQTSLWIQQTNPVSGRDLNSAWAVDYNTCWMCGATSSNTLGYVIRTTNAGLSWTNVTGNMPSSPIGLYSICGVSANEAWVGADDGSVFHTTNGGTNWNFVILPSPLTPFIDVIHFFNQNTGFILGDPVAAQWFYYWTTNAGTNWASISVPQGENAAGWNNSFYALDTGHIWFGSNTSYIFKGGFRSGFVSYPSVGFNSRGIAFVNSNTGVAIMSNTSVMPNNITSNGGINWTAGYTPPGVQIGITCIPGYPYMWSCGSGVTGGVILYSTNNGVNWTIQNSMSVAGYCITFANSSRGWVGCSSGLIYRTLGPDDLNNIITTLPSSYVLKQNYPNPFNPNTVISYSLLVNSHVQLKVFDIMGKEIATLADEFQNAGTYKVQFSNNRLSSGIYFYKIFAGDFVDVKKMMLLK